MRPCARARTRGERGRDPMSRRHHPHICETCQAPLARKEATCWGCGAQRAAGDEQPGTTPGARDSPTAGHATPGPRIVVAILAAPVCDSEHAGVGDRRATDRWVNEGGSLQPEAPDELAITTTRRQRACAL
jgi:hypothetical protein